MTTTPSLSRTSSRTSSSRTRRIETQQSEAHLRWTCASRLTLWKSGEDEREQIGWKPRNRAIPPEGHLLNTCTHVNCCGCRCWPMTDFSHSPGRARQRLSAEAIAFILQSLRLEGEPHGAARPPSTFACAQLMQSSGRQSGSSVEVTFKQFLVLDS